MRRSSLVDEGWGRPSPHLSSERAIASMSDDAPEADVSSPRVSVNWGALVFNFRHRSPHYVEVMSTSADSPVLASDVVVWHTPGVPLRR